MASQLDRICQSLLEDVDEALGAAVVDLGSGMLLSVAHNVPYFTQSYLDAVAAAAVDMFRGKTVSAVESMLSNQRGKDSSHAIKEVQMTTSKTYHFMTILPEKDHILVVLITGTRANLATGWVATRRAVKEIAPIAP